MKIKYILMEEQLLFCKSIKVIKSLFRTVLISSESIKKSQSLFLTVKMAEEHRVGLIHLKVNSEERPPKSKEHIRKKNNKKTVDLV